MRTFVRAFAATTVLVAATALSAQQPTISHGQVATEAADHGLSAAIDNQKRQKDPGMVGLLHSRH